MPTVRYTKRAERDLDEIARFTFEKWGNEQAEIYIRGLYRACRLIAQYPLLGRPCGPSRPKWRRLEHGSHVILYAAATSGITVQRIVHQAQLLR
jgi:toxin ParE1/3/4